MAQVDAKLTAALKQAKTNPMFFVFVAKGNAGNLLVDKRKINAKDADEVKKQCGGGTLYKGRCKGEEGLMVFEVGKEVPPTLAGLTKKIIKQDAGLIFEVEYRFAADLAAEEGQGEALGGSGNASAAVPLPPPQPPQTAAPPVLPQSPQGGAEVMKRLNVMAADIKAALLGPNKARAQALFVSVNGLIKSKDFAQAGKALDELGPLVAKSAMAPVAAAAAVPPAPPQASVPSPPAVPANDAGLAAEWERRVLALEPRVLAANKTRAGEAKWMTLFMSAQDLGLEGEFDKSSQILNKLEALLNAPAETNAKAAAALQQWQATCIEVKNQLRKVQSEILKAKNVNSAKALVRLESVVKNLSLQPSTQQDVLELERWLREDEVIPRVEKPNPWGISVKVRDRLLPVLTALKPQLQA